MYSKSRTDSVSLYVMVFENVIPLCDGVTVRNNVSGVSEHCVRKEQSVEHIAIPNIVSLEFPGRNLRIGSWSVMAMGYAGG
jgi:hypothetical protein